MRIGNLHYLLARGLKGLGEWAASKREEHLELARKAFSRMRSNILAKRNLGLVYLESGDEKKAMKHVDAALKELRKDAELWAAKGILFHRGEELSESLKCLERAVNLEDGNPRFWTARGRLLADICRLEDALDSFDEAIVRDRAFIPAWVEKLEVLLRLGRSDEATQVSEVLSEMISAGEDFEPESEPLDPIGILDVEEAADEPSQEEENNRAELLDFLLQVDGVGESKAEMIFDQGIDSLPRLKMTSIEELMSIRGISRKVALNIRRRIESESTPEEVADHRGVEEAMETARAHLEEGEYEEALAEYDSLIERDRNNEEAWFNRGEVLQALGRTKEAVEAYERVISINEVNIAALMEKANTLLEMGKPLDALECYKMVVEKDPENVNFLVERARILAEEGNHDAAILCYDIALENDPENVEAHLGTILSLLQLGDYERAERCLDTVSRLTSVNEKVWWAKGYLMDKRGRWGAAIQFYDRAISLKWNCPDPWIGKGEILLRQGKHEEAKRCFEKALEIDAKNVAAWLGKASALAKMGQRRRALDWLDDFLQVYPTNERALEMRKRLQIERTEYTGSGLHEAKVQRGLGNYEEATDIIVKAIKENPYEESAWTLFGDVLLDTANPMALLNKLEREASIHRPDTNLLTNKGALLLRLGMHTSALKCFDEALSMDETNERARRLRERCLEETEKPT